MSRLFASAALLSLPVILASCEAKVANEQLNDSQLAERADILSQNARVEVEQKLAEMGAGDTDDSLTTPSDGTERP